MFFMMGITPGRKDLDFHQTMICTQCGAYGRYGVFMTYTVLSLFFIPVFKWGKRYFVETSCCHHTYELDEAVGRAILRGEEIQIQPNDLLDLGTGMHRTCQTCGYQTNEDFEYCPMCGRSFY